MNEILNRLQQFLDKQLPSNALLLQAGLPLDQIKNLTQLLNLPDDLVDLYAWHNGQSEHLCFLLNFSLYSLQTSLAEYKQLREVSLELEKQVQFSSWHASWLPILGFEGEYFFQDLQTGQIYFYFLEDTPRLWFDNLEQMMKVVAEAWEQDLFGPDFEPTESEYALFESIRKAHVSEHTDPGPMYA
jgi:hypothetical protein